MIVGVLHVQFAGRASRIPVVRTVGTPPVGRSLAPQAAVVTEPPDTFGTVVIRIAVRPWSHRVGGVVVADAFCRTRRQRGDGRVDGSREGTIRWILVAIETAAVVGRAGLGTGYAHRRAGGRRTLVQF